MSIKLQTKKEVLPSSFEKLNMMKIRLILASINVTILQIFIQEVILFTYITKKRLLAFSKYVTKGA